MRSSSKTADYETLATVIPELPQIARSRSALPYRYTYGLAVADEHPEPVANQIVKIDVGTSELLRWYDRGLYPGEPLFVSRPGTNDEDDGVLLSVIYDGSTATSFVLILDAHDLSEIGRVHVPHHIPFGFHGTFRYADSA